MVSVKAVKGNTGISSMYTLNYSSDKNEQAMVTHMHIKG